MPQHDNKELGNEVNVRLPLVTMRVLLPEFLTSIMQALSCSFSDCLTHVGAHISRPEGASKTPKCRNDRSYKEIFRRSKHLETNP